MTQWGSRDWFRDLIKFQGTDNPSSYFAHRLNGFQKYRHKNLINFFENALPERKALSLLDVGCATGDLAHRFYHAGIASSVTGIDFVPEAIRKAQKLYSHHEFAVADVSLLPFFDNSFDIILASEIFYYLEFENRDKALNESRRVLRENGIILFSSALGEKYYDLYSAIKFIEKRFIIVSIRYEYLKVYHKFMTPIHILHRFTDIIRNPEFERKGKIYNLVLRFPFIFKSGAMKKIAFILEKFLNVVFSSTLLPNLLSWFGRTFMGKYARSNIMIVASGDSIGKYVER